MKSEETRMILCKASWSVHVHPVIENDVSLMRCAQQGYSQSERLAVWINPNLVVLIVKTGRHDQKYRELLCV